jgi:hypothetical protein
LLIIKAALYTVRCKLHIGLQKALHSQAHLTSPKAGQTGMNSCTVDFSQDMLIVYGVVENVVQMLSSTVIITITIHMSSSMLSILINNQTSCHKRQVASIIRIGGMLKLHFSRIGRESMHFRGEHNSGNKISLLTFQVGTRHWLQNVKGTRWRVRGRET